MKKLLLICLIISILATILCACGKKESEVVSTPLESEEIVEQEETIEEIPSGELEAYLEASDVDEMGNVDEELHDLLSSDEYMNKSQAEKKIACENLLKELENNGEIKNLQYDEDSELFSFEYKNSVLGGVSLKEFDENLN